MGGCCGAMKPAGHKSLPEKKKAEEKEAAKQNNTVATDAGIKSNKEDNVTKLEEKANDIKAESKPSETNGGVAKSDDLQQKSAEEILSAQLVNDAIESAVTVTTQESQPPGNQGESQLPGAPPMTEEEALSEWMKADTNNALVIDEPAAEIAQREPALEASVNQPAQMEAVMQDQSVPSPESTTEVLDLSCPTTAPIFTDNEIQSQEVCQAPESDVTSRPEEVQQTVPEAEILPESAVAPVPELSPDNTHGISTENNDLPPPPPPVVEDPSADIAICPPDVCSPEAAVCPPVDGSPDVAVCPPAPTEYPEPSFDEPPPPPEIQPENTPDSSAEFQGELLPSPPAEMSLPEPPSEPEQSSLPEPPSEAEQSSLPEPPSQPDVVTKEEQIIEPVTEVTGDVKHDEDTVPVIEKISQEAATQRQEWWDGNNVPVIEHVPEESRQQRDAWWNEMGSEGSKVEGNMPSSDSGLEATPVSSPDESQSPGSSQGVSVSGPDDKTVLPQVPESQPVEAAQV